MQLLKDKLNSLGKRREKFYFIFDFNLTKTFIFKKNKLPKGIKISLDNNLSNKQNSSIMLDYKAQNFINYKEKFYRVINEIKNGNTYLLNLTSKTKILNNLSLHDIYNSSNARFKILFDDNQFYDKSFVSFSPERFIKIEDNKIFTYPMKGTIDSNIKNAKEIILDDKKELAEHVMVVDLLRNDLGIIANSVNVDKFRYIDLVHTNKNSLYQISSQISAKLENSWQDRVGDILVSILPAGSITGTPKKKTVEIIEDIEDYDREFFTGVFGYFDGNSLDSAVMIRFIEKDLNGNLFYKSGGGITIDSDVNKEYQEMLDKIYLS
jgi:para-aminobenzoate synthetase component 1